MKFQTIYFENTDNKTLYKKIMDQNKLKNVFFFSIGSNI